MTLRQRGQQQFLRVPPTGIAAKGGVGGPEQIRFTGSLHKHIAVVGTMAGGTRAAVACQVTLS